MIYDGLRDRPQPSDVLVVLGNEVRAGGVLSERLKARLDRAVELYDRGYAPFLLTSGGIDPRGNDEAVVMRDYLIGLGVPPEALLTDSDGWTTRHTAQNTAQLMKQRGWTRALVVTHYYHLARTRLALHQAGVEKVSTGGAISLEWREPYAIAREFVGYYVYLVGIR